MKRVHLDVALDQLQDGLQVIDDIAVFRQGECVTATTVRCRHMGAKMRPKGCRLHCPRHGWELDPATMRYVNPLGIKAAELSVEVRDGRVLVSGEDQTAPWGEPRDRRALQPGELTIRYMAHACMELTGADTTLITDPWLQGPAFSRGWWLAHRPPADWLERLADADAIYISHNHSDHLNPPTLGALVRRNPRVPIYVPAFEGGSCRRELVRMGFQQVHVTPFDTWVELGSLRFMILRDQTDRDDSALLVEYAGHRILDAVDCHQLGPLPEVDVLFAQYTAGASGFPVCWEELLGSDGVAERVRKNVALARREMVELTQRVGARLFVPFAGYFSEAHPADKEIRAVNVKNDPADVCAAVQRACPQTEVWIPSDGALLDVATNEVSLPSDTELAPELDQMEILHWVADVERSDRFAPLETLSGVEDYFAWARFRGELLLQVVETDEAFRFDLRTMFVDLRTGRVSSVQPDVELPLLRMRVRRSVFRHVLRYGLSWDEIAIGFQARFFRAPDVYHFDFWDHFQHHLPEEPLPWEDLAVNAA